MHDLAALLSEAANQADLYGLREERKYLLPLATARALRPALARKLACEQYVPGRVRSRVSSIYFDSPDFALYHDSLASEAGVKFRLRRYGDAHAVRGTDDPLVFFECKLGQGEAARRQKRKLRCALSGPMLAQLIERPEAPDPAIVRPKFWRQALAIVTERALRPRLTIGYEREAYVGDAGQLRVTLDEGYCASRIDNGAYSPLDAPHGLLPGLAILEVKLTGDFPRWLAELLAAWGIPPEGQAFSKYKTAVPLLFPDHRKAPQADEAP